MAESKIKQIIKDHYLVNNQQMTSFDLHLTNLGGESRSYDHDLWLNLNDEFKISKWYINFVDAQKPSEFDLIVSGALSLLELHGVSYIFHMTLREVESFVRDDNSTPIVKELFRYQKFFDEFLGRLIQNATNSLFLKSGMEIQVWDIISYEQKIQASQSFVDKINILLKTTFSGQVKLVNVEESKIIIDFGPFNVRQNYFVPLLEGMTHYVQLSFSSTDINLVAQ